ncbi:hypothetical protein HOY82DRAFT_600338 [Tuber indicum]|nr:hypothetical protein HOY82DRAFT_600338 [Tuber indicum]
MLVLYMGNQIIKSFDSPFANILASWNRTVKPFGKGGGDIDKVIRKAVNRKFAGLILGRGGVAERWAKNRVEAIIISIKPKWSELCREWLSSPDSISQNKLQVAEILWFAQGDEQRLPTVYNSLAVHTLLRRKRFYEAHNENLHSNKANAPTSGGNGQTAGSENVQRICRRAMDGRGEVPTDRYVGEQENKAMSMPSSIHNFQQRSGQSKRRICTMHTLYDHRLVLELL